MKIIAYYRVSTKKQGESGLGLAAQKEIVSQWSKHNHGKIIAEYREVETGKRDDRPKLQEALSHARLAKATLVIAKIDRLARKHAFVAALMDSGVDFIACDNPHANRLTIHILSAVAEDEAIRISQRTRDALAASKAQGKQLGSARKDHWKGREHLRGWKQGSKASGERRSQKAKEAYRFLQPAIAERLSGGWSYLAISDWLTLEGHVTTAGKPFSATAVWRIVKRTPTLLDAKSSSTVEYRDPRKLIEAELAAGRSFKQIAKILATEGYAMPDRAFTADDVEKLCSNLTLSQS